MKTSIYLALIFSVILLTPKFGTAQWMWWANANANGSDYRVQVSYDSDAACSCDNNYVVGAFKNNYLPSNYLGTNSSTRSKRKSSFYVIVGPNAKNTYHLTMSNTGKNNALFNCWIDCKVTSSISLSDHPGRYTSKIKTVASFSASDNLDHIALNWGKGTDIPNGSHGYKIAKDDPNNIVATLSGSARSWNDVLVGPGEQHTYYIYTYTNSWGGHTSSRWSRTGYTRARSARATVDLSKKVAVTWDDLSLATDEVVVKRNGEQIGTVNINSSSDTSFTDSDPGLIPGFEYEYAVSWQKGDEEFSIITSGASLANGRISGQIKTPFSQLPIANARVCATLENDIPQLEAGAMFCDSTNANGQYTIRQIYYHQEASFRIEPFKVNHGFDPGFYDGQILELEFPNITLDFKDTTAFVMSGRITQNIGGMQCGVAHAEIWIDGVYKGVTSDENGFYYASVEESGAYTFEPKLNDHIFEPASYEVLIDTDTSGFHFTDISTNLLSGSVKGGCNITIGQSKLRIYSSDNQICIDTTISTDSEGMFAIQLPARSYEVEVVSIEVNPTLSVDPAAVIDYFNTEPVDLANDSTELFFVYRQPPEISVDGLPEPLCSSIESRVVEQAQSLFLEIEVRESFGDQNCPVESGYVIITDEVSDRNNKVDTIELDGGLAVYRLNPGEPNLIAPHKKTLQITAIVDNETTNWSMPLIVTGNRPREQTFTTVMPEVPFMVLHDPPGDASYSFWEEDQISETSMRFFAKGDSSVGASAEIKLGTRFETGAGYSTETVIWGTIGGGIEYGKRQVADDEWIVRTNSREYFSTSGNESITGAEGDVFLGAAMNLIYALTDVLSVDEKACELVLSTSMIMGNDGFNTTFIYTEEHIENSLIPQLTQLRDLYRSNASDSAQIYQNQITVWQQVLENNRKSKKQASFIENRSFSAGTNYTSSSSIDSTSTSSIEMSTYLDESVAIGGGFEVAGSGFKGKVEIKMNMVTGSVGRKSNTTTTTTGYVLNDDDPGDFFSVNIKKDLVYRTPVFELVSGRSSCPWEQGTQPREAVQIQATPLRIDNVPAEGAAVFELGLGNISQSEEARTYLMRFLQESNPDGAEVTLGGSQVHGIIPYTISPFSERGATVTVKRGPTAFDYPNLQFVLESGCEDKAISDTVSLTASFQNSFPPITWIKPSTTWTINTENENSFFVRFNGYDKSLLNKVQLQFAPQGSSAWHIGQEWLPADLSDATDGHTDIWDLRDIEDGHYDLRLRADYSEGSVYTQLISGMIDRRGPEIFGLAEPKDAILNPGDVIGVKMDELLDCFSFSANQVVFKSLSTGIIYPVEAGCSGESVIVRPLWNATGHEGEIIEIQLGFLNDIHGNQSLDSISWQFIVQNSGGTVSLDLDEDGIPDAIDNCALASNPDQMDSDGDKIGDVCDEDIDGDNIPNNQDNCIFTPNENQMDADSNGIGDICELDADSDGDQIMNGVDNCVFSSNPDQSDIDGDGIGDICDEDADGDGLPNQMDNCAFTPNPNQEDSNGDGVGDACDAITSTRDHPLVGSKVELYPNPADQLVTFSFETKEQLTGGTLRMMDYTGKEVWFYEFDHIISGRSNLPIPISHLVSGMYSVQLATDQGFLYEKLSIVR